ncbi:hypothetical protein BCV72DRAFT_304072 [Rhizopus microsporus var. microsporus]|uniref:Uncharacterized protein n=1 Tax=Rhizopus microsporus var. microsporus TaxID=86635 RepID=A0A1X0R7P8_RHIZD|nr:hypothetical protein BCV72DRAFT_304072 [Rhizopus microsporus var. microsporus]
MPAIEKGGLGLLDPYVHNLLRIHLSLVSGSTVTWPLHIFNARLRNSLYCKPLDVLQAILRTFVPFYTGNVESIKCSITTTLLLPLHIAFQSLPDDYWVNQTWHRQPRIGQFFKYDEDLGCLRPMLQTDNPDFPYLPQRLLRDIQRR